MKAFFNQLFDYNFYCNKVLIEQAVGLKAVPEKSAKLFSHILNAHSRWNSQILGQEQQFMPWQLHEIENWGDIHYENQRTTFEIISSGDDFNERVEYENAEGRVYANDLKDVLFHIINHSTHHRGQILSDLRAHDIEPKPLDFVLYKR